MRTTKLFATFLVAGLIASACAQDPDYVLPAIKVESEELNFSAETEQALVFTATRDWRVQSKPDWVTVVPDQGSGSGTSQRVNICVAANPDYNRSGEVVLTIGLDKAHVAVIQPGAKGEIPVGSGTQEDPYTVTGVLRYIATLGADVESENDVYVTGTISAVTEAYSAQYGNATFEMTSDSGEKFTFYRGLYLGNKKWTANDTQIKVGDAVVVCGKVINFKGNTPETQQNKAYLYSLNGETQGTGGGGGSTGTPSGTGTQADPYNVAAARAAVANLTWTSTTDYQKTDPVYVKGKISKIADNGTYGASGTFGNATFFISDDGSSSNELEAYRILYLGNQKYTSGTDIKVGDEVVIYASLMNYRGNTPETVQSGAYLYSLNGVTEAASGGGNEGGGQGGNEQGNSGTSIFSQAFKADGQGSFTIENKTIPNEITAIWTYNNSYGMVATAYVSSSKTDYASESWLVSPEIDLTSSTTPVLTFRHATNFFLSVDKAKEEATVWVKPTGGQWTKLSGVTYPDKLGWDYVDSGEIDLSAYIGKKVQIGFKYVSTAEKAGTWEVDTFAIIEK